MSEVLLSVRSQLLTLVSELEQISKVANSVTDQIRLGGEATGDSVQKTVRKTETFFSLLRNSGRRVADELTQDFKALLNLESLTAGMKLSSAFKNSVSEAVTLQDTIRKFGPVFGVAQGEFVKMQTAMLEGLGEIGLGSEEASNALQGLAQTQVRGTSNLVEYSKTSGELGSVTGQKGQEAAIAKGLADLITSRGGNVNDQKQMTEAAQTVLKIFNATGMKATEVLDASKKLFEHIPVEMRNKMNTASIAQLGAISQIAGPNSTLFLEKFLKKGYFERLSQEGQGLKGVVSEKGFDADKFQRAAEAIFARTPGDKRHAATTAGMSDEEAEGFVRLYEKLADVRAANARLETSTANLNEQFKQGATLAEAFAMNLNRVKKEFAEPFSRITQKAQELLVKTSGSDKTAAGVVAGGAIFTAILAGGALRGLGKLFGGKAEGITEAAAFESAGMHVQPVYVTNASEMSAGGPLGAAAGIGGIGAGAIGIAVTAGIAAFLATKEMGNKIIKETGADKMLTAMVDKVSGRNTESENDEKLDKLGRENAAMQRDFNNRRGSPETLSEIGKSENPMLPGQENITGLRIATPKENAQQNQTSPSSQRQTVHVIIESKDPKFKISHVPSSGVSVGPTAR